jgi:hypothetical protein
LPIALTPPGRRLILFSAGIFLFPRRRLSISFAKLIDTNVSPVYEAASFASSLPKANVCRVTTWSALENVTELCDMTRFIQTLDMCAFRANVTRLLAAENLNTTIFNLFLRRLLLF